MSHRDPADDPLLNDAGELSLTKVAERMGGDDSLAEARQRLEAHMDNSPLAVIELDAQFRIVRWSDGAQRLFGWTAAEVLGRTAWDLRWVHEDDSEPVRGIVADMLSGAYPRNRHINRNYRKDGGVVYCEWYNSVIYDDQGRPTSIFSQVLDVTRRKAADESLRRSQVQLRSFIRHAPISIAMFDHDMRYLVTSGRWLAEHGRGHCDLVGLNHYQVLPDLPAEWKLVHQKGLAGETVKNDEDLWIQADGSRMWLRWAVQPWYDENDAIGGIIISFEDITEYKRSEEALRHQVELNRYYLDTVQSVIVALDCAGRITLINRKGRETLGYGEAELLGRNWFETCLPRGEGIDLIYPIFRRVMRGEEESFEYFENSILCRDGRLRLIAWHNARLKDTAGRTTGMLSSGEDITERRRAEDALRESEQQLSGIVSSAMDAIVSVDGEQRIRLFNPAAEQMFGMSATEVVGQPLARLMPESSGDGYASLIRDFETADQTAPRMGSLGTLRGLRASGEEFPAEASISKTEVAGEKIFTVILRDITERKRAEDALREADRRKDEFLATLAHELRNPLAPIRSAVEILKLEGSPDATSRRARDLIERQLRYLVRLVDDLMDRNRMSMGRLHLRRERLDLARVLEQAIECARHNLQCAGQALTWDSPPEPIYLDADPVRLEQVFLNLLDNACKYTGRGGRIGLTAKRDGTDVVVIVSDTGIGIAREHLPRLFEMFVQIGAESQPSRGGLGIGLALARGLVEMHGGRIEARSEGSGKGAEFLVRLPIVDEVSEPPSEPPEGSDDNSQTAARRILVVDDNPDVVESLALFLRVSGYEVETAHDGPEAVESAARARPDLVLLDIGMPGMDGYAVCRCMRAYPWGKDLAILAMTGWGHEEDRLKTREAGFSGHLVKPVDTAALQRLLADPRATRG
jgi:PAS domain S-box-containing protein